MSEPPIPRYCPLEHPPDLCTRGCGMGACELVAPYVIRVDDATADKLADAIENPRPPTPELVALFRAADVARCYACDEPLDYVPSGQPALCGQCENVP